MDKIACKTHLEYKNYFLTTFLKSLLNFRFRNLKKQYKIWYSQGEKRCQNLNCQKQQYL